MCVLLNSVSIKSIMTMISEILKYVVFAQENLIGDKHRKYGHTGLDFLALIFFYCVLYQIK